ncbi:MAG: NAD(P)/FAD-dependent oxidoreductase [Lachnospiraceae bacterium]|nr:NAD(P)/FAD-dependent oxidoreductase [Lachnospiraceae bacterium]
MSKVVVVGGGASGMMAAYFAAAGNNEVILLEKNEKLGKKIYITGKGRCNYSNTADMDSFLGHIVSNPKFMYSSLYGFFNGDMTRLLNENGCPTKEERGGRLFPLSDHASDVTAAITRALKSEGVDIRLNTEVKGIRTESGEVLGVYTPEGEIEADCVILATGGLSYPTTGSTGDGHRFAEELGLKVTKLRPSLVSLHIEEDYVKRLQGLSLRNVTFRATGRKKTLYQSEVGELVFTDRGLSGPIILSASAYIGEALEREEKLLGYIDLKPALDMDTIDKRIIREVEAAPNKKLRALFAALLPGKLAAIFPEVCGVDPDKKSNELKKTERAAITEKLKSFPMTVTGAGGYNEAVITQGGISVKEIDPSTMQVKRIKGLYCVGELLDVDALTGGYNLQIAFSTGALAGRSV